MGSLVDLVTDMTIGSGRMPLEVEATVTPPGGSPISTSAVWLVPTTEDAPIDAAFARREIRRVIALRLDEVPTCPRGTVVSAPPPTNPDGTAETWKVDGVDLVEANHRRVVVVPG